MSRLFGLLLLLMAQGAYGEVSVRDAAGTIVRLPEPARRIVSLTPHLTENLFAAGAGERIVATVEFSDYPEAARRLPRIGTYQRVDFETMLRLRPDLVVAWRSGTPAKLLEGVRRLGVPVYLSEPESLEAIADDINRLGILAGTRAAAEPVAEAYRQRLRDLRQRFAERAPLRVFYQIWDQPMSTIGGRQIITQVLSLCRGQNVFASLAQMAPVVSREAVLAADPEVVVAAGMDGRRPEWLDDWKRWPALAATRKSRLYVVDPDLLHRSTPRLLDGVEAVCTLLDNARR